jgi:glycosyltransferase involved in cell wall biosynthesis
MLVMRGAERTFAEMSACWPQAPIHTLLYDSGALADGFAGREVHASYLQRLGVRQRHFRYLLPLFPRATESLATDGYEAIVSSSSAFAHGIGTDPGAVHVCYCHTPFRYAWHDFARTVRHTSWYLRPLLSRSLRRMRDWDLEASKRVTHYVANSQLTRERIAEFWGREASVVHPPVDVHKFHVDEPDDYFLVVAELTGHKRVDVALEAAGRAGRQFKVVGGGPDLKRLARTYGSTAHFLGRVTEPELRDLYARAQALVVPNVEEFGIAAVEAQASGRPVLGATVGGTCDTVVDGVTGVLVTPENVGALAEAMTQVDFEAFSPDVIRRHASQFSAAAFKERFAAEVARLVGEPITAPPLEMVG